MEEENETANARKTVVVSLFGGPGAGKSTLAAVVFASLKMLGVNCELVTEFAKDKVWEKNNEALSNQIYIFAKQYYRMSLCAGKVDVVVTDSPLFLSPFYNRDPDIDKPLKELAFAISGKFDNLDYFVCRVNKYNPVGRLQTEEEADEYALKIKDMAESFGLKCKEIPGETASGDVIVRDVLAKLNLKLKLRENSQVQV